MTIVHVDEQLIADLFDIQPDSVVWFVPIMEQGEVVDFTVQYCNETAITILRATRAAVIGQRLSHTELVDDNSRKLIFSQCLQVWNQGEPVEYTYYNAGLDRYFSVQRSKVMQGILSVTRDRTEEIKKEIQIKEQSQLLHNIIEGSSNGISLYRSIRNEAGEIVDFRLQLANQKCAEMTAFTLEELHRHTMRELMAIRGHTIYFDICKKVVETGEPRYIEYFAEARRQWIAFSIVKHEDGYLLTYMDITKTKEQAEYFKAIFDTSFNGIMVLEGIRDAKDKVVDFRIIQVNPAFTSILRLKPEEVQQRNYLSIFPKSKDAGIFDLHVQVLQSGASVEHKFHYDGEGYDGWYQINIARMGNNTIVQTFLEITESMRYQAQLEQAALFLQNVINGSHTGILVVEPVLDASQEIVDYRFKTVNRTLASLVQQEPEALIGTLHSQWFPEYLSNGAFEAYKQISITGADMHFENHFQNEQHDRWMDVSGRKVGNDVLISFHEFTELKKLQQQLEGTIDALQQSNERLSQFTHVASHDLREPLRKIKLFTNLLEEKYAGSMDEGPRKFLDKIQRTVTRMQSLIDDLLNYAQLNSRPNFTSQVSLTAVVENVLMDLEGRILEKEAKINVAELPLVTGDATQLQQLFQNLISNAIKFHKEGQAPVVQVYAVRLYKNQLPAHISALARFPVYNCISVSDHGIGFESEHANKIFRLFQRLHDRSKYEGTGIGLAIVSKVAENHNGLVWAESKPGGGATFNIALPHF